MSWYYATPDKEIEVIGILADLFWGQSPIQYEQYNNFITSPWGAILW